MSRRPIFVGYDISSAFGQRTGIGHAAARLLDALADELPDNWRIRALFYSARRSPSETDPWRKSPRVDLRRLRIPGRALLRSWQYLHAPPIEALLGGVALHHSPASYVTPALRARRVITVHDLCFLNEGEAAERDPFGSDYFLKTFPKGLARADHIIAVSEFTRGEAIRAYGIAPEKISVIHHGVDRSMFSPESNQADRALIQAFTHGKPYFLCVASFGPRSRKNAVSLLEAYAAAKHEMADLPLLVFLGHKGSPEEQAAFEGAVARLGLGDRAIQTGYVPDEALPAFYRGARALVMPSLCEGFGMPVTEAMACGCPVLAAAAGALPEVAGGAARLFDPRDPEALARALLDVARDGDMFARLHVGGIERAKAFTWESAARRTIEVYREALGQ